MLVLHISVSCLWSKHHACSSHTYIHCSFRIYQTSQVGPTGPNYFYQWFRNASNCFLGMKLCWLPFKYLLLAVLTIELSCYSFFMFYTGVICLKRVTTNACKNETTVKIQTQVSLAQINLIQQIVLQEVASTSYFRKIMASTDISLRIPHSSVPLEVKIMYL